MFFIDSLWVYTKAMTTLVQAYEFETHHLTWEAQSSTLSNINFSLLDAHRRGVTAEIRRFRLLPSNGTKQPGIFDNVRFFLANVETAVLFRMVLYQPPVRKGQLRLVKTFKDILTGVHELALSSTLSCLLYHAFLRGSFLAPSKVELLATPIADVIDASRDEISDVHRHLIDLS
ncbi:hypothetical protein E2P81_ATG02104 [Venturia nashicola]|nr:hypothetical protein E2P81_ATG02104 [Venturia nashicola]